MSHITTQKASRRLLEVHLDPVGGVVDAHELSSRDLVGRCAGVFEGSLFSLVFKGKPQENLFACGPSILTAPVLRHVNLAAFCLGHFDPSP